MTIKVAEASIQVQAQSAAEALEKGPKALETYVAIHGREMDRAIFRAIHRAQLEFIDPQDPKTFQAIHDNDNWRWCGICLEDFFVHHPEYVPNPDASTLEAWNAMRWSSKCFWVCRSCQVKHPPAS